MVKFGAILGFMFILLIVSSAVALKSYKNSPEPIEPSFDRSIFHAEEPAEAPKLIILNPTMEEVD